MPIPFDYETLRLVWWLLLGVLLIGFALTELDLGVAAVLPFVARTDEERRLVINSIGATWEGNQVWFILGGGAIFAAWPWLPMPSASPASISPCSGADGADPAAGRLQIPLQEGRPEMARPVGTGRSSSAASCPPSSSGWPSAMCWKAPSGFDDDLRATFEAVSSISSHHSPCWPGCSVAMLVLHGAGWLSLKMSMAPCWTGPAASILAGGLSILLFALGGVSAPHPRHGRSCATRHRSERPLQPAPPSGCCCTGAPGSKTTPVTRGCSLRRCLAGPVLAMLGIHRRWDVGVFSARRLAFSASSPPSACRCSR